MGVENDSGEVGSVVVDQARLYATADAKVWAEEFAKVHPEIDQGFMIGWFANIACIAEDQVAKQLRGAMRKALDELGVPGPGYPTPVANAVRILAEAGGFEPIRCSPQHPCDKVNDEHIDLFGECFVKSYDRYIEIGRGTSATDIQVVNEP